MPILETSNMLIRLHHNILTSVNAVQGDTGRMWHFIIDDYEIPLDAEVRMYVKKPSGKEIYNPAIVEEQTVSFQPTLQTLAEIGQSIGQIQILSNGQSVSTFPFFLNVEKNYILTSGITSENEFLILDELIEDARATLAEMKALIKTVTTQETARVEAEKKRVSAENARVEAENLRKSAETSRSDAEKLRVSQEDSRKSAESNRVNAENIRVSQENTRKSSETTRTSNENDRKSKESERISAESARKNAETSRVSVEKTRVAAETARVEAENLRQQNTTTAINNANSKANLANEAANNANTKATLANDAATRANSAAQRAEEVVADINIIAITNSQIDSLKSL